MLPSVGNPLIEPFLAAAEAVARERKEVDLDMAREVLHEAATVLHNGLALDGLDEHDTNVVVAWLCLDLVARDPGAAVRARAEATSGAAADVHDPGGAVAALQTATAMLQI